ncbi:hypothetical protein [Brevibacillus migulae]|uniref:hypothetical protein n=1 Tax=Brevibacillus migulae TaxID=1644114 RepID=UPI00106E985E|nr:hypothetical protein [Brevibacillus migulae]
MKEQTIYSYKLLRRFRWGGLGLLFQLILLISGCLAASVYFSIPMPNLIVSTSILVILPILHFSLFRFYAYLAAQRTSITADTLFSAWWGAGTALPVTLAFFWKAEATVIIGSLLVSLGLFVWLPRTYGLALIIASLVLLLPRLLSLIASLSQPKHCRVKYELRSVAFLLTNL